MKVKRNTLLLLACLVWSAAGFNILRIGLIAYPSYRSVLNFILSILVFAVFQIFVFGKLVKKQPLGEPGRPVQARDIARANRLLYASSALFLLLCLGARALILFLTGRFFL